MAKYRKKPVIIEAEVYQPGMEDGFACYEVGSNGKFIGYYDKNDALPKTNRRPAIKTLEGFHEVSDGDYIITGVKGERYPCKPDIFHMTYEKIEENNTINNFTINVNVDANNNLNIEEFIREIQNKLRNSGRSV